MAIPSFFLSRSLRPFSVFFSSVDLIFFRRRSWLWREAAAAKQFAGSSRLRERLGDCVSNCQTRDLCWAKLTQVSASCVPKIFKENRTQNDYLFLKEKNRQDCLPKLRHLTGLPLFQDKTFGGENCVRI